MVFQCPISCKNEVFVYFKQKESDNLGTTVVKTMFKFTNARAKGF